MENTLCAGGRAFMKVGRNIVEVRVLEKVGTCWQVSTRTGKTVLAREIKGGEPHGGTGPVASLALVPYWQPGRAADPAPAAVAADAPADAAEPAATDASADTEEPADAQAPATPPITPSERAVPPKGLSLLNAAAAVLERSDAPMSVKAMIEGAVSQGLWSPHGGKTPEQTLYSAIIREISGKGGSSRFRKDGRGLFAFVR